MSAGWILLINFGFGFAFLDLIMGRALPYYIYNKFGEDVYEEWQKDVTTNPEQLSILLHLPPQIAVPLFAIFACMFWIILYPIAIYMNIQKAKDIYEKHRPQ